MNKRWFHRMLLSYVPVFFIVITFLFVIFFQTINQLTQSEAIKANESLARQAIQSIDSNLKSIDHKIMRETMVNKSITQFFAQQDSSNVIVNMQAVKSMQDLIITFPLIDTIYLVRYSDNFVLSNNTSSQLEAYSEAPFIKQFMKKVPSKQWTDLRTFQEFNLEFKPSKQVVTLVRGIPFYSSGQGLIVVNVNLSSLQRLVGDMYSPDITFVRLLDHQNRNLLAPGAGDNAKLNVLSEYTSGYTGWKIQSGLVHGGYLRFVTSLYNVWIIIGFVVALMGIGWMIFVTRKNYRPIESIVSRIQSYSQQRASALVGGGHPDEFKFIESALENMIEQTNRFQQQHEEDLVLRKKYLFEELLEGTRQIDASEWKTEMHALQMPETFERAVVFVLEIDKYADFCVKYNYRDQYLLKFVLTSVIQEMAGKPQLAVWTEWTANQRLAGIVQMSGDSSEDRKKLVQLFEACREWISANLQFTATIGVGLPAERVARLHESYNEALEALKYKAAVGLNRVIWHEETIRSQTEVYPHLKLIHALVEAYRLAEEEWQLHYDALFRQIRTNVLPKEDILSLLSFLGYHLDREMMALPKEFQDIWRQETKQQLSDAFESFDTLEEIESKLLRLLTELQIRMQSQRESKNHHSLMKEMRKYIEHHYTNPNMSLEHLSDIFEVNGKYLSKLFKEEFGEKFVDFLIALRIDHAKRLLVETRKSVQEIGEAVGYTSSNSFNRVFKSVVGLSPGEYRKDY